ncbi:MAG: DUF885 family protein [Candidatus Eisenbacteria bacterium]|nr:DUF885 family protein [Candidatus Eisenbacteria bacterium]
MASALAALGLALALAPPFAPAACAASAGDRVRALGEAFVMRLIERSPDRATRLGIHDHDDRLIPVTQATLREDRDAARALEQALREIPDAGLPPARALERELLLGRCATTLADLEIMRPFERDPLAYLPLIAGSVRAVFDRVNGPPCGRTHLAARRLAAVPEALRAARINVSGAPPERVAIAIERLPAVLRFYRETVPALAAACHDGRVQADLAEADSAAIRAVEAFIADLREARPAPGASLAVGAEACGRWIAAVTGERPSLDSLRVEAEGAVDLERARVDALAAAGATAAPVRLDRVRIEEAVQRVTAFVADHGLVTGRTPAVTVRDAAPCDVEPLALDVPGPWEEHARQIRLDLVGQDADDLPAERRSAPPFTHWDADRLAIGAVTPGSLARHQAIRRMPTRLAHMLAWSRPGEAWAGFAERLMLDEGYAGGADGLALAVARTSLRRHARTLAALGLYSGTLTLESAGRMLVERCGLDQVTAAYEARMAASDPHAMVYTHAVSSLIALRDEARRRLGPAFRTRAFVDAALRAGGVPGASLRARVLRDLGVNVADRESSGAAP